MTNNDIINFMIARLEDQIIFGEVDAQELFESVANHCFPNRQQHRDAFAEALAGDRQVHRDGLLEKLAIYEQFHKDVLDTLKLSSGADTSRILARDVDKLRAELAKWELKWTIN